MLRMGKAVSHIRNYSLISLLGLISCSFSPPTTEPNHAVITAQAEFLPVEERSDASAVVQETPLVVTNTAIPAAPVLPSPVIDFPDAPVMLPGLPRFSSGGGTKRLFQRACHEYIVNGDFETGDFTGWSQVNSGSGAWFINTGDPTPISNYDDGLGPIAGTYDAISDQTGPGLHLLTQPIVIPPESSTATLRFKDRIRNRANVFSDPNQEYRVTLVDSLLNPVEEIFSTNPGDPLFQIGPNEREFDLTDLIKKHEGQEIAIRFEEQDDLFFFNVNVDDVSLIICSDCGNGHKQSREQCDDGNNINGDGCSQDCKIERLFGSDDEGNIITFDTETISITQLGSLESENGSTEIECNVGATCYSQGRDGSFEIERVSLSPPSLLSPPVSDGAGFNGLEFVNGTLYGAGIPTPCVDATLYILNPVTGTTSAIGPVGTGRPMSGLAFNPATNIMYGVDGCGFAGNSRLHTVNLTTGVATLIGSTGKKLGSLEFGPDGKLYAGGDKSDGGNIYRIDTATGAATFVIASGLESVTGLALSVKPF